MCRVKSGSSGFEVCDDVCEVGLPVGHGAEFLFGFGDVENAVGGAFGGTGKFGACARRDCAR